MVQSILLFFVLLAAVFAVIGVVAAWKGVSLKEVFKAYHRTKQNIKDDLQAAKDELSEEMKKE